MRPSVDARLGDFDLGREKLERSKEICRSSGSPMGSPRRTWRVRCAMRLWGGARRPGGLLVRWRGGRWRDAADEAGRGGAHVDRPQPAQHRVCWHFAQHLQRESVACVRRIWVQSTLTCTQSVAYTGAPFAMNCQTIPTCKGGLFGAPAGKMASELPLPAPFVVKVAVGTVVNSDPPQLSEDHELYFVGRVRLSTVEVILLTRRVHGAVGVDVVHEPGLERRAGDGVHSGMRGVKHLVGERGRHCNQRSKTDEPGQHHERLRRHDDLRSLRRGSAGLECPGRSPAPTSSQRSGDRAACERPAPAGWEGCRRRIPPRP